MSKRRITHTNTMDSRVAMLGGSEPEFNSLMFEKKLSSLKDSQESINSCSAWCLENRKHHKKIVMAWLNVLKRVKIDHRLTLFYLANDVIQYSKRKSYDFVESWGTTLQKATTMVREEKVKHKILRIFQIWEQRGVYSEEFIADLSGLISAAPSKKDDMLDFQSTYCISKIKSCSVLEKDTDTKLKMFKEHHPKSIDDIQSFIKDRSHVHDAEQEIEDYIKHIEVYVKALQAEIKARAHLISVLSQADKHYEMERKQVKVVANAYRTFGLKVKDVKRKLDDMMPRLGSPVPSPDINAPSPEPDSDIELPMNESNANEPTYTNPGFYNPMATTEPSNFATNGFSSFIGSAMPFNLQNFDTTSLFTDQNMIGSSAYDPASLFKAIPPPPPVAAPIAPVPMPRAFDYGGSNTQPPLMPPPLPPFTTSNYLDTTQSYTNSTYSAPNVFGNNSYQQSSIDPSSYIVTPQEQNSYQRHPDEYNPEEELETWDNTDVWDAPSGLDLDTPESPPLFEKESFASPIEYDESKMLNRNQTADVDQRVLLPSLELSLDGSESSHRAKDVDHRNLISLTGSPGPEGRSSNIALTLTSIWGSQGDQDYRNPVNCDTDQDYRVPFNIDHQNIPLPLDCKSVKSSPIQDNVESIDMELSDDELENAASRTSSDKFSADNDLQVSNNNNSVMNNTAITINQGMQKIRTLVGSSQSTTVNKLLEPPPPIPHNLCEMPDLDSDANEFLDNLSKEINSEEFLALPKQPSTELDAVNKFNICQPPPIHGLLGPGPGLLPIPSQKPWNNQPHIGGDDWNENNFGFMLDKRRNNVEPPPPRGGFHGRGNGNYFDGPPPNLTSLPPPSIEPFDGGHYRGGRTRGFRHGGGLLRPPLGMRGGMPRSYGSRGGRGNFRGGFRGGF